MAGLHESSCLPFASRFLNSGSVPYRARFGNLGKSTKFALLAGPYTSQIGLDNEEERNFGRRATSSTDRSGQQRRKRQNTMVAEFR